MENSEGFSWPETVLSLSIIFIITTTILPFLNYMVVHLEDKKRDYHSALVMYEVSKMYTVENMKTGGMQVNKIIYSYEISTESICIDYDGMQEKKHKCMSLIK